MALHEQSVGRSDEWYTPPLVFEAMRTQFDLDVAHPGLDVVDWVPAARLLTRESLDQEWGGYVWMNPPFGGRNGIVPWLEKFMRHGDGVALTPDRTSCPWWQTYAPQADAVLFWAPKIRFVPGAGAKESAPAEGTTLFAKGAAGVSALRRAAANGHGYLMRGA